jgi:hypothetical protein
MSHAEWIAQLDQALAGTDEMIRGHLAETRSQMIEGHKEEDIMLGLHDYLVNWTQFTREEFATMYMRVIVMAARSGESN